MRVAVVRSEKNRELKSMRALAQGIRRAGDEAIEVSRRGAAAVSCDAAVLFGVKSKPEWDTLAARAVKLFYVDKGYLRLDRGWRYMRLSFGAPHPLGYVTRARHELLRWRSMNVPVRPWRKDGRQIVIAGSSEKYHRWHGLPHPTEYAQALVSALAATGRPIVYRPKPSWEHATPVEGASFSSNAESLAAALAGAHCLVTHGSNACFEAALSGVPSIVLGEGIAAPISSRSLDEIEAPRLAAALELRQWLANVAWCQWTRQEFMTGLAWRHVRKQLC